MKLILQLLIIAATIVLCQHTYAVNRTWSGSNGDDFNTPGNWTPAGVPSAADNVIISDGDMVINMSASATINDFTVTCTAGGSRLLVFNTNGNVLTVNGVTSVGADSSDEVELHANAAPGGFIFNGNVTFDNGFGSGQTQIKADVASEGSMTFNADLTTGAGAFTEPGIEPKFYFDKAGTQTWTFNSTSNFIVPQSIIVGVANTPTVNFVGSGSTFMIGVYDGSLTINSNCTLDIGTFDVDNFIGGALSLAASSTLRTGGTNSLPTGYTGGSTFNETSTVEFYGSNQSIVAGYTYGNLLFTGSGTKTSLGDFTVGGNFTSNTNWDDGDDTHTFTSGNTKMISGTVAPTFYNLTVNNSSANGLDMTVDVTVDRQLTMTNGRINITANTLTVTDANTARISGYGITDYINTGSNGVLRRSVNATGSYDLPVGNANSYQLANINITGGSTVSSLNVNFDNLATGISGLPFVEATYDFTDILNNGGASPGVGNANNGVWTISPNTGTATYDVSLYGRNHDNEGTQRHTVIKRSITGGVPTVEINENFDGCSGSAPAGWSTTIVSGTPDWDFNNTTFGFGYTIDGTCMASFDDDAAGSGALNNNVELYSPIIDMSGYATGTLVYDYNHQVSGAGSLTVEVYDGTAWQQVFFTSVDASGNRVEDITIHMNASFQVRWTYDDGGAWSWGVGIDNVTLTGSTAAGPYGAWAALGTYSSSTLVTPITAVRTSFSGFSQFSIALSSNIVLPLELLSFTGQCEGNMNVLKWVTATEVNNDFFTIERSSDAVNFELVEYVSGAGNSNSLQEYSFTDNSPYNQTYYSLKQTDFNGEFEYLGVISVISCEYSGFNFVPYQKNDKVLLDIVSDSDGDYLIKIIDLWGRDVLINIKRIELGDNIITLSPNMTSGIYFVRIKSIDKQKVHVKKILYSK